MACPTDEPGAESPTPDEALERLVEGHRRFLEARPLGRDLAAERRSGADGQRPFAAVLGCVDSRVTPETIFDQGLGALMAVRVAGNVVNDDGVASLEFACAVAGARLVVVLGHTRCGAVRGAADGVELGRLGGLLEKLQPALEAAAGEGEADREAFLSGATRTNVQLGLGELRERSGVLSDLEREGRIRLVGAVYDVVTGGLELVD
ncbi:MAG: carbonic anhydrase [Planctomycetota bacterium]|nr:carbonic anhydrase [Planctomycetota bacterium]MDP6764342.1 carbonic anhydrase [Planctomycetota bacterium]MDP6988698.1 carbonic anhydrase [Planctomycetota bacterium]